MEFEKKEELILHYIDINKYDKAKEVLEEIIKMDAENGYYKYLMGICYYKTNFLNEAISEMKEAIRLEYFSEDSVKYFGIINYELGEYEKAYDFLSKALEINPEDTEVLEVYTKIIDIKKSSHEDKIEADKIEAEKLIKKALKLNPNDENVLRQSFDYYKNNDNIKEMIEILNEFTKVSSDKKTIYVMLGEIELLKCKYLKAKKYFTQAFLLDPNDEYLKSRLNVFSTKFSIENYSRLYSTLFDHYNKCMLIKYESEFMRYTVTLLIFILRVGLILGGIAIVSFVMLNLADFIKMLLGY